MSMSSHHYHIIIIRMNVWPQYTFSSAVRHTTMTSVEIYLYVLLIQENKSYVFILCIPGLVISFQKMCGADRLFVR